MYGCSLEPYGCSLVRYSCSLGPYGCSLEPYGCSLDSYGCSLDAWGCSLDAWGCSLDARGCRYELTTVPRLAAALRELPPPLREAEGSWQHGLLHGARSAATALINPTSEAAAAGDAAVEEMAAEAVPALERVAGRVMARSSASLCFFGTGAMKPSSHRNVRPQLLLHVHTHTHVQPMPMPCTRMPTPCTRHVHSRPMPCHVYTCACTCACPQVSALLLRLPPPPTSFMLREQLHFYFSPQNLPRDRFLLAQIAISTERCVLHSALRAALEYIVQRAVLTVAHLPG